MRIIVNDSSALIDLKKGALLEILVGLPFEFVVSDALLADELLSFTKSEAAFMRRKMTVVTLDGEEMKRVAKTQASSPALSLHDCSALVIAQREIGCILLTGDRRLRTKAEAAQVECHGVLWVVEEIAKAKLASSRILVRALRLPASDLNQAIHKFKRS